MGLLDKALGSSLPTLVNHATADAGQILNESFAAVQSKLGGTGAFKSLTANAPSFAELTGANPDVLGDFIAKNGLDGVETSGVAASDVREEVGDGSQFLDHNHKVKLVADVSDSSAIGPEPFNQAMVVFDNMPQVNETRNVDYEALSPPQLIGEFQKYRGTKSTQWSVDGVFIARTTTEAKQNWYYLRTLRAWTMSYFGDKVIMQYQDKLGAPPPVLKFSGWRGVVGEVPVVLTNVNVQWPIDCDWIPTGLTDKDGQQIPFPTVIRVTLNLVESFSPNQFNNFDLNAFKAGDMVGAYSTITVQTEDERSEAQSSFRSSEINAGSGIEPANIEANGRQSLQGMATDGVAEAATAPLPTPETVSNTPTSMYLCPHTLERIREQNLKIDGLRDELAAAKTLSKQYTDQYASASPAAKPAIQVLINQQSAIIAQKTQEKLAAQEELFGMGGGVRKD